MANDEKLIQIRVNRVVWQKAEAAFNKHGLTTNNAIRAMVYSVGNSGKTPFDQTFGPKE
jgi:antitoxin component of RelBE/YafQ-DinJ toxin-antitoxin module